MKRVKYPAMIYGLYDPRTNKCHYVGITRNAEERFMSHMNISCNKGVRLWVQDLKVLGLCPEFAILEKIQSKGRFHEKKWINRLRADGEPLFNVMMVKNKSVGNRKVYKFVATALPIETYKQLAQNARAQEMDLSRLLCDLVLKAIGDASPPPLSS